MQVLTREKIMKDLGGKDFSKSFEAIPNPDTKRYVIKIRKLPEYLTDDTSHVLNWKGEPTGIDKGLLFRNGVDETDQLVETNGEGIMIINQVNDSQSSKIDEWMSKLENAELSDIKYFTYLKEIISKIDTKLGLTDMDKNLRKSPDSNTYVRTNDSVEAAVSKKYNIVQGAKGASVKVDDKNIEGQEINKGDIVLFIGDEGLRKIDKKVFLETYLKTDGSKFSEEEVEKFSEEEVVEVEYGGVCPHCGSSGPCMC